MMPVVFRIPWVNFNVPGYGLALMIGFLLSVIWAVRRATKSGANPDIVLNCAFIALLGGVAGARFMFVVHYWDQYALRGGWVDILRAVLDLRQGGLEVYGGLIAATLGVVIYMLIGRHSLRWYLDILAPSTALGMGLGRIGCLLNGCCWGGVCDLPWAVEFPYGSPPMEQQWTTGEPGMELPQELIRTTGQSVRTDGRAAVPVTRELLWITQAEIDKENAADASVRARLEDLRTQLETATGEEDRSRITREHDALARQNQQVLTAHADIRGAMRDYGMSLGELQELARHFHSRPVHPTQLYSVVILVLLALLLNSVYWRRTRDGQVICLLLLVEPWSRYLLEVIRADNPHDTLGEFTISQFLGVMLSAVGLIGLIALRFASPRSPRAKLWEPEEEAPAAGKKKRAANPAS